MVVGTSQGWGEDYPCQGRLVPIRIEQSSRGGKGHVLSSRQVFFSQAASLIWLSTSMSMCMPCSH